MPVFWSFEKARDYVRALGLKSERDWKEYSKSGGRPAYIPSNPYATYRQVWKGYRDWLGTEDNYLSPDGTRMKRCASCPDGQQWHPATLEYFPPRQDSEDGMRRICKECRLKENRDYKQARREELNTKQKQYYLSHREEQDARNKEYMRTHPEIAAKIRKNYMRTHRVQKYAYNRKYQRDHREQFNAYSRNRRSLEMYSGGSHTGQDIQKQYAAQKGKCYYCKAKVGKKYHVDHVIPLSQGGSNNPENLVIACPTCNIRKHNKVITLF